MDTQPGIETPGGNGVAGSGSAPPMVGPLGGTLVDRHVAAAERIALSARAASLPSLRLADHEVADLTLIGNGAYSPLRGFVCRDDYRAIVSSAALSSGTPWTLPITLAVTDEGAASLREGTEAALYDRAGRLRGIITVADVFERDPAQEARDVYRTEDVAHPGVAALMSAGRTLVGGEVHVLPDTRPGGDRALDPAEARAAFAARGWSTVVAFQTRNPIHRAHEYLTKVALEMVDGLFLHPLVGGTKDDDVSAAVRMECYRVLLEGYYPQDRVVLGTFPAAMRYAGPREAIYHGLVRRNYGCSHFIIGRDAAGVGTYYGSYDAQKLYDELGGAARLGFTAMKFEHTFFCSACDGMASTRTCPHPDSSRLILSGTAVRQMLTRGEAVPAAFTRPEVAEILRTAYATVARRG